MAKRRPPLIPDDPAPQVMRAVCRNVMVSGKRTSVRMEPLQWECLVEICDREGCAMADVINMVERRRGDSALTAALRIFILGYFRTAADSPPMPPLPGVGGLAEDQVPFEPGRSLSPVFQRALQIFN